MLRSLSYNTKVFLALSFFLFTSLTVINLYSYFQNQSAMENNLIQNKQLTTMKIQEQVDDMLKEMDKLSISVNASDAIMNVLKGIPEDLSENFFANNIEVSAEVRNILFSFTSLQPLKGRISLVSRYGDYLGISNKMDSISGEKLQVRAMKTFYEYLDMDGFKEFLLPRTDPWSTAEDQVLSIIRPLRDNYNVYGFVEISYFIDELEKIFFFRNDLSFGNVLILDANQSILYSNFTSSTADLPNVNQIWKGMMKDDFGHNRVNFLGADQIAFYSKMEQTDWVILLVEDFSIFRKPIMYLRYSSITFYLTVMVLLLVALYVYTNRVTRPIRKLRDSLANIDLAKLELLPAKLRTRNEVTLLGMAFQELLDELKRTIERADKSKHREMVAQMNALQAQVNPHFLYNTLTVIAAYGKSTGNSKVVDMCIALTDMLRYSMKFDRKDSTIGSELEHVDQYLTLMKSKYEGFLEITSEIDPAIGPFPIPRLSLQPIVENVFQHGFAGIEPPWKLTITCVVHENSWYVSIRDNGIGMSDEKLKKIRTQIQLLKENPTYEIESVLETNAQHDDFSIQPGNGIGLMNVVARLFLFYENNVEVEVDAAPGRGTSFSITGRKQIV